MTITWLICFKMKLVLHSALNYIPNLFEFVFCFFEYLSLTVGNMATSQPITSYFQPVKIKHWKAEAEAMECDTQ